jgi:hypothetical protein
MKTSCPEWRKSPEGKAWLASPKGMEAEEGRKRAQRVATAGGALRALQGSLDPEERTMLTEALQLPEQEAASAPPRATAGGGGQRGSINTLAAALKGLGHVDDATAGFNLLCGEEQHHPLESRHWGRQLRHGAGDPNPGARWLSMAGEPITVNTTTERSAWTGKS